MMSLVNTFSCQVDPQRGPETIALRHPLSSLDSKAHAFVIQVMAGEQPASLSGVSCTGWFIRADGVTVPLDGTVSGHTLTITLAPACYTVPGRFRLSVKLESAGVIHTLLRVQGFVEVSRTDDVTSPGTSISSFDTLAGQINGISRRDRVVNLLDNSDFTNPVNQRGWTNKTSVAAKKYFIDRWMANAAVTPELTSDGISASTEILQLTSKEGLVGKTVTGALCLSDGTLVVGSGVVPSGSDWTNIVDKWHSDSRLLVTSASEETLRFRVVCGSNTVRWAALYEGAYTADTLPAYQPKGYAAELMECQRYYIKYTGGGRMTGFCTSTILYIGAPLIGPMRVTPTLTVLDLGTVRVSGNSITPTKASLGGTYDDTQNIQVTFANTSGIGNHVGVWTGKYELSADYQP